MNEEIPYLPFSIRELSDPQSPLIFNRIPIEFRNQFLHALDDYFGLDQWALGSREDPRRLFWADLCDKVAYQAGMYELRKKKQDGPGDFSAYLRGQLAFDKILDAIEITLRFLDEIERNALEASTDPLLFRAGGGWATANQTIAKVNNLFRRHRLGYRLESTILIKIDSDYLHSQVTAPAVRLLANASFESALDEFMQAHKCYSNDDYSSAIVKAESAFESTMKLICDAKNWPYPEKATVKPLIDAMFKNGNLADFQLAQLGTLRAILENGLPELRNHRGGHGAGSTGTPPSQAIAAFALHLCAANIVFLIEVHEPFDT